MKWINFVHQAVLLKLQSFDDLFGHPAFGTLWETVVLANLKGHFPQSELFFYRTSSGAEIDFVLKYKSSVFSVECKASQAPKLSKGNHNALADIGPDHAFVVIPADKGWPMKKGIDVVSLQELIQQINSF